MKFFRKQLDELSAKATPATRPAIYAIGIAIEKLIAELMDKQGEHSEALRRVGDLIQQLTYDTGRDLAEGLELELAEAYARLELAAAERGELQAEIAELRVLIADLIERVATLEQRARACGEEP